MTFQRFNNRSAKVNGEAVMWIRQQYSMMQSYPAIRAGLQAQFGVTLSIQQITRIAKGESFAQLPVLPTNPEVDMTMHLNALRTTATGAMPSKEEIQASIARTQELVERDNAPREGIHEILAQRNKGITLEEAMKVFDMPPQAQQTVPRVLSLEEVEERERIAMGASAGSGLDKLMSLAVEEGMKPKAQRLLDELGANSMGDSQK